MCDPCCIPTCCVCYICRHMPCIPKATKSDLLMFGDSSIDMLKVTAEFKQRQAWPTIVGQFDEAGYRVANMACGGAPMYQLCLVSPCVLCCNKPTTGIITAMGGNDFTACPGPMCCPGYGSCCATMGCDCVGMVWGCFMCQVGSKLKVITLADYVQSEYIGKDGKPKIALSMPCASMCGWGGGTDDPYVKYGKSLMRKSGVVFEPRFVDLAAGIKYLEENANNAHVAPPPFAYTRTANPGAAYPNLIYIDHTSLVSGVKASSAAAYAKLFGLPPAKDAVEKDGTEGELSALAKAMWVEWMLHAAKAEQLKPPENAKMERHPANKVAPE